MKRKKEMRKNKNDIAADSCLSCIRLFGVCTKNGFTCNVVMTKPGSCCRNPANFHNYVRTYIRQTTSRKIMMIYKPEEHKTGNTQPTRIHNKYIYIN